MKLVYCGASVSKRFGRPGLARTVLLAAVLLPASSLFAGFAATEVYLPAVGRVAGAGDPPSQFYTTTWISNLTGATVHFSFQFLKQGQANPAPQTFNDTLAPGQTKLYENVVETKLGLSSAIGAARITADGEIFAAERIYNQFQGDPLESSVGLFFSGVPGDFAIGLGQSATIQGVNQGGSEDFRYNFALVETAGMTATAHVSILDADGSTLGSKDYLLGPYEQIQPNVSDVVPAISTINARVTATVTAGAGRILLAGAQLANQSQDPSGFEMSFRGSLLSGGGGVTSLNGLTGAVTLAAGSNITITPAGNTLTIAAAGGGGGLASVSHDATLAGDGTPGSPLGLALPLTVMQGLETLKIFPNAGNSLYAESDETSNSGVAIWGRGRNIGVYGELVDGSNNPISWGELGRAFNGNHYGALGVTFDPAGSAVLAQYAGVTPGTAIELQNGALKVSGSNPTAFVHTATAGNTVSGYITQISNPLTDGDPNAILIVTHSYNPPGLPGNYLTSPYSVYYTGSHWHIYLDDFSSIVGKSFNVLVIKR
jgi:hypothetical protein